MATLTHNSPLGDLDIPGVGVVKPGEPFTVDDSTAKQLLLQSELYSTATETTGTKTAAASPVAEPTSPPAQPTESTTTQGETK